MDDRWAVFDYERSMVIALGHRLTQNGLEGLDWDVRNAIVENAVLHTRILCEILLSRGTAADDITLKKLLPDFSSPVVDELRAAYGDRRTEHCPCWQFNKMLAHPTTNRSTSFDYVPALNSIWPMLQTRLD